MEKFIGETYKYYTKNIAWAFNVGYLECLTDNTDSLKYGEINNLLRLNSEIRGKQ